MLTEDEFKNWCRSLNLSELARKTIEVYSAHPNHRGLLAEVERTFQDAIPAAS